MPAGGGLPEARIARILRKIHAADQHRLTRIHDILGLPKVEACRRDLSLETVEVAARCSAT